MSRPNRGGSLRPAGRPEVGRPRLRARQRGPAGRSRGAPDRRYIGMLKISPGAACSARKPRRASPGAPSGTSAPRRNRARRGEIAGRETGDPTRRYQGRNRWPERCRPRPRASAGGRASGAVPCLRSGSESRAARAPCANLRATPRLPRRRNAPISALRRRVNRVFGGAGAPGRPPGPRRIVCGRPTPRMQAPAGRWPAHGAYLGAPYRTGRCGRAALRRGPAPPRTRPVGKRHATRAGRPRAGPR